MSRRALLIALGVSLALNVFVVGAFAGAMMMGLRPHGGPPFGPRPPMAGFAAELTPAERTAWLSMVRQMAQTSGGELRQARELRRQAWQGLGSGPADSQGALAKLDQSRALEGQARADMDRAVVSFVTSLPPDGRRKLAEALARQPRFGRAGPHGRWSGGRAPIADRDGGRPAPERALPDR